VEINASASPKMASIDNASLRVGATTTQSGILDDTNAGERQLGIDAGTAWLGKAEAVVVYTDYGVSRGMQHRIEHARGMGLPIETREIGK